MIELFIAFGAGLISFLSPCVLPLIPDIIVAYVSKFMSLQAGDIITTGTPPGVGMGKKPQLFLKAGDELRLSIDNLGEQNSKIVSL